MYFIKANILYYEGTTPGESNEPNSVYGLADAKGNRNRYSIGRRVLVNLADKDLFEVEGGLFTKVMTPNGEAFIIHLSFDEVVKGMLDRQR